MRKILIALCLLAWIPTFWNPLCGQAPEQNPGSRSHITDNRGTPANPFVVDPQGHKQTDKEASEAKKQAAEAKFDKDRHAYVATWMLRFTGVMAIATVILMFVGAGGVIAALRTLDKISRQVDLQERAMAQWVNSDNWRSEMRPLDDDLSAPFCRCVRVGFDLINPTRAPLTIPAGEISFLLPKRNATVVTFPRDYMLVPGRPYQTDATLFMSEEYGSTDCPWCGAKDVPKFSRGQITCGKIGCQEQQRIKALEKSHKAKSKRASGAA